MGLLSKNTLVGQGWNTQPVEFWQVILARSRIKGSDSGSPQTNKWLLMRKMTGFVEGMDVGDKKDDT